MPGILFPDIYVKSILDIPLDQLQQANIRAFILDLDNTITEWNSNKLSKEIIAWFDLIKSRGFKACILSNNGEQRVITVARRLDIPYIFRAQKPRRRAFQKAVALMGLNNSEVAVIGDQIFTDILGGNRAGLFTILVVPIAKREFAGTKISRCMEFFVLRRFKHKL
ncbi:MAG: YqeG family HAD IIIA-type phosphatase [Syntrophomonadaceae bacterium]|jgi:HAD superfamily phosphatase (TIGR01668 family)